MALLTHPVSNPPSPPFAKGEKGDFAPYGPRESVPIVVWSDLEPDGLGPFGPNPGKEGYRMNGISLPHLPLSAKVFCTLFLLGIGLGSLAAFTQAATAVGLSYGDVVASLAPEMPMTHMGHGQMSAEKQLDISQLSSTAKVWIRTPLLIQTSHTHLFGQTLIAGLLGLIFLFSSVGEGKKAVILALPFIGTIMDIGGMWLTRFVWPPFAVLVPIGGSAFALGYVTITVISLYEIWLKREAHT